MIANLASAPEQKTGVIGTLGWGQTEKLTPLANTTPSAIDLQDLFWQMRDYELVAMEVSSHGLVQQRVAHSAFDIAVFTNLSRDHLDYHGTMLAYGEAKLSLLTNFSTKCNVVNFDDAQVKQWLAEGRIPNPVLFGENLPTDISYPFVSLIMQSIQNRLML